MSDYLFVGANTSPCLAALTVGNVRVSDSVLEKPVHPKDSGTEAVIYVVSYDLSKALDLTPVEKHAVLIDYR